MALEYPVDTDDGAVPRAIRRFIRNRVMELAGLTLFAIVIALGAALATWSPADPSFDRAIDANPANLLGWPGAVVSDLLIKFLGLAVIPFVTIPLAWAANFFRHRGFPQPFSRSVAWLVCAVATAAFLSLLPAPRQFALEAGLGGQLGAMIEWGILGVLGYALKGLFAAIVSVALFGCIAVSSAARALGLRPESATVSRATEMLKTVLGKSWFLLMFATETVRQWLARRREAKMAEAPRPIRRAKLPLAPRVEPKLGKGAAGNPPWLRLPADEAASEDVIDVDAEEEAEEEGEEEETEEDEEEEEEEDARPSPAIGKRAQPTKKGKGRIAKDSDGEFALPPLTLLAEPKKSSRGTELSDEQLEQNARALEGVLEDFGVRGQIVKVRPGPVVTLYELEPAPGIKSSRVISLADDIARSMSAISARVAVVSGRNAIGIELPNTKRETVFLRELLGSEAFENTSQNLSLALGKNIGGEPVFADLARMPHLLIAGTTGSGKSVGINTMILSLLYRHTPDRCKLIMIDPKMLELSVYEGIPHLLAPVVTDPRKAVVALKWAVREMEDRYRKMSKVGVRNIDGFNARVEQARSKGEQMSRTVQTGFDAETGEPIFEREEMALEPMPYIVVIIDEMADLMMVAGKDIEGAVQRLAQMARAAGIHVVMATQRPSVDVITGTIKANFPTRISFQVTSKIDSRTILGEQGAEQLLGQGDMLHMAGGGRISRLHGAFVADDEVEKIVRYLKKQGAPEYVDAVTEELDDEEGGEGGAYGGGEGGGSSGDSLYDQAVAVVLRDKKVSTSYVQRRLQIGYNKAASLIERMEKEGLISAANATGKREILVPGDSARV